VGGKITCAREREPTMRERERQRAEVRASFGQNNPTAKYVRAVNPGFSIT